LYLADGTKGESCSESQASSLGPNGAKFIEEQQLNNDGGLFGTPPFTQILFDELGIGTSGNLPSYLYGELTGSEYTEVGPLQYGGSGCVPEWSCFTVSCSS